MGRESWVSSPLGHHVFPLPTRSPCRTHFTAQPVPAWHMADKSLLEAADKTHFKLFAGKYVASPAPPC